MEEGNANRIFSKRIRAGSRRTYFLDVKTTKSNDYYLTITESKKRFNEDGYERHKVFLYKEDFNKFLEALNETINYVKTELLPDYDFDEFSHKDDEHYHDAKHAQVTEPKADIFSKTKPAEEAEVSGAQQETTQKAEEPVAVSEEAAKTTNSDSKVTQDADDLKWE